MGSSYDGNGYYWDDAGDESAFQMYKLYMYTECFMQTFVGFYGCPSEVHRTLHWGPLQNRKLGM